MERTDLLPRQEAGRLVIRKSAFGFVGLEVTEIAQQGFNARMASLLTSEESQKSAETVVEAPESDER